MSVRILGSHLVPEKAILDYNCSRNTVFGAFSREKEVDWVLVIRDIVKRLLATVGKSKPIPICPYILHLYKCHDTMRLEDKKSYMIEVLFLKHNVKPDQDNKLATAKDSERESLSLNEMAKLQA